MSNFSTSIGGVKPNRHSTFSYAMLLLALSSMVFLGVCNPQTFRDGISGTAASVSGLEISNREFSYAYQNVSERLRSQYGDQFNPAILRVAQMTMNQLIDDRILFLESQKYAFSATDDEVFEVIGGFREFKDEKTGKFSRDRLEKYLRGAQISESALVEDQRRAMSVSRLRQFVVTSAFVSSKDVELDYELNQSRANVELLAFDIGKLKIDISPEEITTYLAAPDAEAKVQAWYDSHISDYKSEEKMQARHILIAYKDARNAAPTITRSKDEARALAEKLLSEVKSEKADFADVAKKNSDERNAKKSGGDLGTFVRADMVPEFSTAAFALEPGKISSVVESPFGFHIIKAQSKHPAVDISMADAKNDVVKKMLIEVKGPSMLEEKAKKVLDLVVAKSDAQALLAEMGVEWQSVSDFNPTAKSIPKVGAKQNLIDAILTLDEKSTPVYKDLIKSGNTFYIARLVSLKKGDSKGLDKDKIKQLAYTATFTQGYSEFSAFQEQAKKDYEARGEIYMNPQYLAVDDAQAGQES